MAGKKNIIITGFMGTGKTVVGNEVARRLSRRFHDIDQIMESRTQMSISDIFDRFGEDHFRKMEREVLENLVAANDEVVISTGGGTLLSYDERGLSGSNVIFCLQARIEVLVRRLNTSVLRPLLRNDESGKSVGALLKKRESQYSGFSNQVDTSDRTPEQVADEILAIFRESLRGHCDPS